MKTLMNPIYRILLKELRNSKSISFLVTRSGMLSGRHSQLLVSGDGNFSTAYPSLEIIIKQSAIGSLIHALNMKRVRIREVASAWDQYSFTLRRQELSCLLPALKYINVVSLKKHIPARYYSHQRARSL